MGRRGGIIREIEDASGVLLGVRDVDEESAMVTLVGLMDRLPRVQFVLDCIVKGISSIIGRLPSILDCL